MFVYTEGMLSHTTTNSWGSFGFKCVRACVCACVCACMRAYVMVA